MTAVAGSTRTPISRIGRPSTSTRPAAISSSQARRLPTPAAARTFCRRTPDSAGTVDVLDVGEERRERRQLVE